MRMMREMWKWAWGRVRARLVGGRGGYEAVAVGWLGDLRLG